MTTDRDVGRLLDLWLAEGVDEANDRVLDSVEARIGRERQRPGWRVSWRDAYVNTNLKLAAGLAAALAVAVVAWQVLPVELGPGGQPSTPPPTPTPIPSPTFGAGPLAPGTYVIDAVRGIEVTLTIPEDATGWEAGGPNFLGVPPMVDAPDGVFLGFNTVSTVDQDPCTTHFPKAVGGSVEDLAAVWSALPHAEIVGPTDIEVSGFDGVRFELTIDADLAECPDGIGLYYAGGFLRVVGPGQRVELWAVDVAGTRLVVEGSSFPEARAEDVRALDAILESIRLAAAP